MYFYAISFLGSYFYLKLVEFMTVIHHGLVTTSYTCIVTMAADEYVRGVRYFLDKHPKYTVRRTLKPLDLGQLSLCVPLCVCVCVCECVRACTYVHVCTHVGVSVCVCSHAL